MEDIKPADITASPNNAPADGGKNTAIETPDYLADLKAKDERIAKLQQERDNYKSGMLKYKKQSDKPEEPTDEDRFRQIAREEMLNSQLGQAYAEKDALAQKMAKELSEAKVALANKSQISNIPGGSSQPNDVINVEKLTAEQKADLEKSAKKIGADPKKYIERFLQNLEKNKNK